VNKLPQKLANLSDAIDAVLPQTQCTRCGYPACRPYADAIAAGHAAINQCPPGGDDGIRRLAELTGQAYQPLNPAHGVEEPRQIAIIDETRCIGCTVCIKACPVDAILGGFKHMHTVLTDDCTGCELCVAPCPVDCIEMRDLMPAMPWTEDNADRSRRLYQARQSRLTRHTEQITSPTPSATQLSSILERAKAKAQSRLLGTTARTNDPTSTQD
jgi:Na+-translocating ferredoxin:NAD+ oxidoreductase subunit B